MHIRRLIAVLVVALLTAGALASAAGAATKNAFAGSPVQKRPAGVPRDAESNAFYPRALTIRVGDRVRWRINGFHTVTFPGRARRPPPFIAPDSRTPVSGVTDPAGAPFWFNGQPRLIVNPLGAFPVGGRSFDGRRLTSSGNPLLVPGARPKPYTLRFTRAGTFRYFCTVHLGRPDMAGLVRVVPRRRAIPSAAQDRRTIRSQFGRAVARIKRDARFDGPAGNAVELGNDTALTAFLRFFPQTKTVRAGETLTFSMSPHTNEAHTATFGPPDFLRATARELVAPDPASPPGGPPTLVFSPLAAFPSDPPPALPPYDGTNHGNGFLNTGTLDRDPTSPNPPSARITFTTPGSYGYICLIHPEMRGTVVVT